MINKSDVFLSSNIRFESFKLSASICCFHGQNAYFVGYRFSLFSKWALSHINGIEAERKNA